MKKTIKVPLVRMIGIIAMVAIIGFGFAACGDPPGHSHSFGADWVTNTTHHWHECTAGDGEKSGYAEHNLSDGKCTTCGYDSKIAEKIAEIANDLAEADGGDSADDPIELKVEINLGNGSQANSGWRQLLDAIATADKYVDLDLSDCTLTGTTFSTGNTGNNGNTIPDGMDKIVSITLPNGVQVIGFNAFYGCTGLTSVDIPDTVTTIDYWAFDGCTGLTSVTIGNSVTSIGDYAFRNCSSLTSVTIPDSVQTIPNYAFYGCTGLTSVNIPDSVTTIGGSAFYGCTGLTSVDIPNSVTTIGGSAFRGCTGLTSVTIPDTVTTIGSNAFYDCTGLTSVTFQGADTDITAYDCFPNFQFLQVAYTTGKAGTYTRTLPNGEWTKQ